MSTVLEATMDYYNQRRRILRLAVDQEQAVSWLNHARRRLREIRADASRPEAAVREAERVVLDHIRILAGNFWDLPAVPSSGPRIVNQGQTTNLDAMRIAMPSVAPVGPGSNTREDPLMLARNQGAYFCPWHGRYVNHDTASCSDGMFFESHGVSLAQFQGLGLQVPTHRHRSRRGPQGNNQTRDSARQENTGPPSVGPTSNTRGDRAQFPPRGYEARGERSDEYDRRRQHGRSRSPRRRQHERSHSPRRRQDELSRSPRRQRERRGMAHRPDMHNRSSRRQGYRDRSPLRQRERSGSAHRPVERVRLERRRDDRSRSPHH